MCEIGTRFIGNVGHRSAKGLTDTILHRCSDYRISGSARNLERNVGGFPAIKRIRGSMLGKIESVPGMKRQICTPSSAILGVTKAFGTRRADVEGGSQRLPAFNRNTQMRFVLSSLAAMTFMLASTLGHAEDPKKGAEAQQVVVHLSHFTDDLHRCFMALKVSGLMQEHGAKVTLFLDMEGVRLAQRRQELSFTWGKDSPTLSDYYDKFIEGGGKVVLCPHCAKSAHVSGGGLRRNAEIATMPSLGKMLIDADKIMDY